jgi:hypothetical protein
MTPGFVREQGGTMRRILVAVAGALVASAGTASAQGLEFKPIDTNKAIVQPAEASAGIFTTTTRYVSRAIADTIDNNGIVKTLNNLLGRRPPPTPTTQPGFSPLPLPGMYPSTGYKNSFTPAMPTYQVLGQTPGK